MGYHRGGETQTLSSISKYMDQRRLLCNLNFKILKTQNFCLNGWSWVKLHYLKHYVLLMLCFIKFQVPGNETLEFSPSSFPVVRLPVRSSPNCSSQVFGSLP